MYCVSQGQQLTTTDHQIGAVWLCDIKLRVCRISWSVSLDWVSQPCLNLEDFSPMTWLEDNPVKYTHLISQPRMSELPRDKMYGKLTLKTSTFASLGGPIPILTCHEPKCTKKSYNFLDLSDQVAQFRSKHVIPGDILTFRKIAI